MKKSITRLILLLAFPLSGVFAQQPTNRLDALDLQQFELPNGEPGNHVQAIVQDRYGFMWFGSQYGLHRWDGNQFRTYLHDPNNPRSISSDYIECIMCASDGSLWIGTWGSGLNRYDPSTNRFTRYYANRREGLSDNAISAIAEDKDGFIWVGTMGGLDRLDPRTGDIVRYQNIPNDKRSLSCNQVRSLLVDSDGTLWVGTGFFFDGDDAGGLNRFRPETNDFDRFLSKKNDPTTLIHNEVRAIYEDKKGQLWVGTDGNGLHRMDKASGTFKRFKNEGDENSLSIPKGNANWRSQVTFLFEDKDGLIWIGNWAGGIKCYDPATGQARIYNTDGKKGSYLLENNAWAGFQSKDGVRWFSTASDGARVYRTAGKRGMFNAVYLPTKTDAVKSICEDGQRNLLISTQENLFGKLDSDQPNLLPEYQLEEEVALAGSEKIVKGASGKIWGMKANGGLVCYDPLRQQAKQFTHQKHDPTSLPAAPLRDILPDKKGNLWLATYGAGLVFFDGKSEQFTALRSKKGDPNSLPHDYTGKLFMDNDGALWVTGGGKDATKTPFFITRFAPASQQFTRYKINDVPEGSNFWQSPPAQDEQGFIWVCLDAGLLKLNPETGECGFFDQNRFGTKGGHLKGMTMDNDGRLWVLSDKLLAFDPVRETVFSYGGASGLSALPFEQDAIFKNEEGLVFVGGRSGLHFFDPRQLDSLNMTPPTVRITGFELLDADGPESRYDAAMGQLAPLKLKHDENVFTFSFSALDFNDPDLNRLEFKLENFDDDWRVAGQDLKATYVKVPPGTYQFRVRGANSYGVWGKETSVVVTISPPWWLTWWAWSLYAFLVAAAIFMAYRLLLNRRMERQETLRLKELDNAKNRLFANITHEFRTPLTIILGMAENGKMEIEKLKKLEIEHGTTTEDRTPISNFLISNFDLIERNGTNLLGLVNQMLELSKLENGAERLNLTQGDVVGYLKFVTNNFHSMATDKQLGLHFLSDLDELVMEYDAEKLQRVLSNLLSNALKFTPAGGNVYVTVNATRDLTNFENLSNLTIKVRDTGPGIPAEKLPKIFDRFFQGTESAQYQGSGIGLALTKEFVKLMGGDISARSRAGEGAEFVVALPIADCGLRIADWQALQAAPVSVEAKEDLVKEQIVDEELQVALSPLTILPIGENIEGVSPNENDLPLLLLIEDNPDVMTYLKTCLSSNYRVVSAVNGQEGVELATQQIPDLVVTDVMMPVMNGYEVCRFLKNDERTSHVPVIMLTAKVGFESRIEGLEQGADAYLAKPFHREELLLQIRNLLETRRRLQRHYRSVAGIGGEHFPLKLTKNPAPEMKESEDYFVRKVRRAVEAHLDDAEFNVEGLCKEIGMSHSHLHRKLSALTGCSATKFIRNIRLAKAKELLENPALTITSVAFDSGFNDPGYFGRVFKQEFGMTPVEWRDRLAGVEN